MRAREDLRGSGGAPCGGWRRSAIPFVAGAVPLLAGALAFRWVCDDAYIAFRYARNLARGDGLRFNVDPDLAPVEGFTQLGWVGLCAVLEALRASPATWAPVATVLCGLGLLVLVVRAADRAFRLPLPERAAAAAFLGTLPPMFVWSTGGLGTMAFALAIFGTWYALFAAEGAPRPRLAPALCVLTAVLRADGVGWVAVLLAAAAAAAARRGDRAAVRRLGVAGALVLLALALQTAFRLAYYGDWLPNTARAKVGLDPAVLAMGGEYVISFLLTFPSVAVAWLLAFHAPWSRSRVSAAPLALAIFATVLHAALVGGDFMAMGRFLVPALPFTALLFGVGIAGLRERASPAAATAVAGACLALSVLPAFDVHAVPRSWRAGFHFRHSSPEFVSEVEQWRGMKDRTEAWIRVGRAVALHTPPDASLVAAGIGAVGYHSDRFLFDQFGLTWPEVAEREVDVRPRLSPGHLQFVKNDWFAPYGPTYLRATIAEAEGELGPGVDRRIDLGPEDVELVRLDPERGFEPGTMLRLELGPGHPRARGFPSSDERPPHADPVR